MFPRISSLFRIPATDNNRVYKEHINDTQKLIYLSKKQINKLYKQFCSYEPDMDDPLNPVLPGTYSYLIPELRVNPLKDRIIKVFSMQDPDVTFDSLLDMMSVFSIDAPFELKTHYAFRIIDFDDDNMLSEEDLRELLNRMKPTNHALSEEDSTEIIESTFFEADSDADGFITYSEFERLISKSPDFLHSFHIRI